MKKRWGRRPRERLLTIYKETKIAGNIRWEITKSRISANKKKRNIKNRCLLKCTVIYQERDVEKLGDVGK